MKEEVPKETEKIAARRAARAIEKVRKAKDSSMFTPAWWTQGPLEILLIVSLFILNLYLIYPAFGTEAAQTSFSGPVIPLAAKLIEFFNVPFTYSLQYVVIFFFALFPVSLYLFIRKIGGRKLAAFLAILFTTLPIYPFAFSRIGAAFYGEDAPHIASLSLIPLALLAQIRFLRDGKFENLLLAAIFVSLVVLISPFGFFVLAIFATITTFSEMLLGKGRLKVIRFFVILAVAAGLSSFWYNPQFATSLIFGPVGEEGRITITKLIPISMFLVPVLAAFGFLLFDRRPELQPLFLASFYTIAFAIIVVVGGGFFPSHPSRYLPEFGISLAFLGGIAAVRLTDFVKFSEKFKFAKLSKPFFGNAITVGAALALIAIIIIGRARVDLGQRDVLGLWTDVSRGRIWLQRERFSGLPVAFGYSITGMTVITLGLLGVQSRFKTHGEEK